MSGHTPGPWEALRPFGPDEKLWWIYAKHPDSGEVSHAEVRAGCTEADELGDMAANARLIAAAPELLEALRPFAALLAEHHERMPDDQPIFGINSATFTVGDMRRARAAINKATGEA